MIKRWVGFVVIAAAMGCGSDNSSTKTVSHTAGTINGGLWKKGTHTLQGTVIVANGILTVEACSTIKMASGGKLTVRDGGAIKLLGRQDCPINITSSSGTPAPGDWKYVEIYGSASTTDNAFDYVNIEYGGGQGEALGELWIGNGASISISNTTVHKSSDVGVYIDDSGAVPNFTNNHLIDNAKGPISLGANSVSQLNIGEYAPNGVEGVIVRNVTITKDATWLMLGTPYVVPWGLLIEAPTGTAKLTVSAGAKLLMGGPLNLLKDEVNIRVSTGGGFKTAGTPTSKVVITSAASTPKPGDWGHIWYTGASVEIGNVLAGAQIEYGGGNNGTEHGAVWLEDNASVRVTNSIIRNSLKWGVELSGFDASTGLGTGKLGDFSNNSFSNNGSDASADSSNGAHVYLWANQVNQLLSGPYETPASKYNRILIRGGAIEKTATWLNLATPYVVEDTFIVGSTGTALAPIIWTLRPGARVMLMADKSIEVRPFGVVVFEGNTSQHVKILPYPDDKSNWGSLVIGTDATLATLSRLSFVEISSGGGGGYSAQVTINADSKLQVSDLTMTKSLTVCDIKLLAVTSSINVLATAPIVNSFIAACPP